MLNLLCIKSDQVIFNTIFTSTIIFNRNPAHNPRSITPSKLYPPLKPLRKLSTSLSNLLDNTSEYTPSQDTTSSLFVPHHRYNLRDLPSRRLSTDTSTLNLSALSSNSTLRLLRQHAQPLSSETNSSDFIPSPYFTSGFDTASLLSSDARTAFLSGNLFSEVIIPTPVPAHIRIPEYYTILQINLDLQLQIFLTIHLESMG